MIEVVAFARALAYAGEHRIPAMRLRNVVDQLHDDDGLADTSAAEQADLAAFGVGRQQIDDFDTGDENFRFGRLVGKGRRRLVDWAPLDRKSTRLNSSHANISYAVFCLKKKKK